MRLGNTRREYEKRVRSKKNSISGTATVKLTPRTEKKRQQTLKHTEKVKFVSISVSLLEQALQTNVKLDGGGSAFKETLDHARDAARDASEPILKKAIEQALALFTDNKDGTNSRELIEDMLEGGVGSRLPIRKEINVFVKQGGEMLLEKKGGSGGKGKGNGKGQGNGKANGNGKGKGKGEKLNGGNDAHDSFDSSDPDDVLGILVPKPNQPKFILKAKALHAYLPPSTWVFGEPATSTLKVPGETKQGEDLTLTKRNADIYGKEAMTSSQSFNIPSPIAHLSPAPPRVALRHIKEHPSVTWQHGPFKRDVGVKIVVSGEELRGYEPEIGSPSKSKKKKKGGGEKKDTAAAVDGLKFETFEIIAEMKEGKVKGKVKAKGNAKAKGAVKKGGVDKVNKTKRVMPVARVTTPVDNTAPSRAARYAMFALKMAMETEDAEGRRGVSLHAPHVIKFRWQPPLNWTEGKVERKAKEKELPEGGKLGSSYVVKFVDGERMACVLDGSIENRGVGRAWCTFADWASFMSLPLQILESFLIGQKVRYTR